MTPAGRQAPPYGEPPRWQLYGQQQPQPACSTQARGQQQSRHPPSQQPSFPPGPAPEPTGRRPGKRRHARNRRRRRAYTNILSVVGLLAVILAIAAALSGSPKRPAANSKPTPAALPAAEQSPTISLQEQQFVSDMQNDFSFQRSVTTSDIATFGQDICAARQGGHTQASEVRWIEQNWSNTQAASASEMVKLAERDICPSYLSTRM